MKYIICGFFGLFFCSQLNAQTASDFQKIGYLLSDALFYSEKYIIPITDAAVYQASSGWVLSPKKKKKWTTTIGLHGNAFIVPNRDRSFNISNSDFQFFQIEGATTATVSTALGNDSQSYLSGEIGGEQVRFKTPKGVNQETIIYPYLQASIELPYGFEAIGRFSTKTQLKKGEYQVYGGGLKYNLSQFIPKLENNNFHLAVASLYSNATVTFDFLDVNTAYGNLGINQVTGYIDTWHFNFIAGKEFKNFDLNANLIFNTSNFEYLITGPKGSIEEIIPFQSVINNELTKIEDTKTNFIGEISGIYHYNKFSFQSSFAFGKFANINLGIQYNIYN